MQICHSNIIEHLAYIIDQHSSVSYLVTENNRQQGDIILRRLTR